MSTRTQTKTIGSWVFGVSQLPGRRAIQAFNRLGRVMGPALSLFLKALGTGKGASLETLDLGVLGDAIPAFFGGLGEDDLNFFINTFLETSTVDGKPLFPQLDLVFMGGTDTLYKVLLFAVEVNYGNFLEALRGLAATAEAPKIA